MLSTAQPFALYMICVISPLILQGIINLLTLRSWWDLHTSYLGRMLHIPRCRICNNAYTVTLGLALTGAVTETVKLAVGRPRPGNFPSWKCFRNFGGWRMILDLIDRCKPQSGAVDAYIGLSNSSICTETDWHILNDGWKSFPSGHSSCEFTKMLFGDLHRLASISILCRVRVLVFLSCRENSFVWSKRSSGKHEHNRSEITSSHSYHG